jgi:hypothetical protein
VKSSQLILFVGLQGVTKTYQPLEVKPGSEAPKSHLQLKARENELKLLQHMIADKRRYVFATVRGRCIDHFDISGLALLLY